MPKKKTSEQFKNLSWDNLREWAGSKIISRGRSYQQQKLVSKLAITDDGTLIALVDGSEEYATKVAMEEDGLPNSICTCPYEFDCKHGVAVVLEYLERVRNNQPVPKVGKNDEPFSLFDDEDPDNDYDGDHLSLSATDKAKIDTFLKDKTKTQLVELVLELAGKYPEVTRELADNWTQNRRF